METVQVRRRTKPICERPASLEPQALREGDSACLGGDGHPLCQVLPAFTLHPRL